MNKHFCSLLLSIFAMFCSFAMVNNTLYAQDIDLGIRFTTDPPETVKINGFYGVKVEVFMDENTSAIPSGEIIRAKIDVIDPDGLSIDGLSYVKLWSGFQDTTNGFITNDSRFPEQFTFQIPWSQQEKWADNAEWTILAQVFSPSLDANAENNVVEKKIKVLLPDLTVSNLDVKAIDPKSGLTTDNFVTSTNYSVSGVIENIGEVVTQNGIYVPLVAELINSESGNVLDTQTILIPDTTEHFPNAYIATDQQINFTIDQLFLPASESSYQNFSIRVRINPQDLPGGPAMKEQSFADNTVSSSFSLTTNNSDVVTASALLEYVPNSYKGETGAFRGLEPIFLSFAIRNSGNSPVLSTDSISASIILSQDLSVDSEDFILREFNLGGDGIGQGMLAGETINLTWFQQLPDNFEGDYYILIRLNNNHLGETEPRRDQVSSLDSTPILTLQSQDKGVTELVETSWSVANNTPTERPDSSKSGRFVVFEKEVPALDAGTSGKSYKQIFYMDMQQLEPLPKLVTRSYGSAFSNIPANGDSFRPRISDDGSTIVFYSRASNLVPGDSNGKEDIFIYQISTKTMRRIVNDSTGSELNGRSLYPDVNGDGSRIVFETDATNALSNGNASQGRQIFLWSKRSSGSAEIVALTAGEASSFNPSIDESGNRIVFESYENLLKDSDPSTPDDNNSLKDIYLIELNSTNQNPSTDYFISSSVQLNEQALPTTTYLVSLNFRGQQTEKSSNLLNPGHSSNARISGNGASIVFESNAQNLISGTGIAKVVVTEGGFGYQGTPSVEITDEGFNAKGAPGEGAILVLKKRAINALEEIVSDGVVVIDSGAGYTDPKVRIIPDPLYPSPLLEAKATAYLGNPDGDIYMVNVGDLNGSIAARKYAYRISEDHSAESVNDNNGTGGNFASRDPSISWDGRSVVYSTKSYNLLQDSISREDGKSFFNSVYVTPSAKAVIVGEIGEIEIAEMGTGYSAGNLRIEDMTGSGSGALASYEVDNLGRIVSIKVVSGGTDYNLDHTVVSVEEPRGGEGFVAGELRFPQAIGDGSLRTGGGRIHRIEMTNHGYGFKVNSSESSTFSELFDFEGDGADLDNDGFPDGRVDPRLIHEFEGKVYLEQKFSVGVMSDGADLLNTRLSIAYKNNFLNPLLIDFSNGVSTSSTTININNFNSASEIRDEIIRLIVANLAIDPNREDSPIIEDNATGETVFSFSALSGRLSTNNPSAVRVTAHSNMLVPGSGYTKASPVINQVPAIFGFSEILSNPSIEEIEESQGRMSLLVERDEITDDVYLYSVNEMDEARTERISVSSFGTPIMYLSATEDGSQQINSLPSNRFPSISGNGRYVFFTSDSSGREGIGFEGSNQLPTDMNPSRDLYMRDLKTEALIEQKASLEILYPNNQITHDFASQSTIPIICQLNYDGFVSRVEVYMRQVLVATLAQFGGGNFDRYQTHRFTGNVAVEQSGDYSLYLVAYDDDGAVIATSPLVNFSVKDFQGSLTPDFTLESPVSNRATSTSIISLNASGEDLDDVIETVRFYVDGEELNATKRNPNALESEQTYSTLFSLKHWIEEYNYSEEGGLLSLFAVAEDATNNFVASNVYNISYTKGTAPPTINFTSRVITESLKPGNGLLELSIDSANNNAIKDLNLTSNIGLGSGLFDARVDIVGPGNGAVIIPHIETNSSNDANYSKVVRLELISGGQGYDLNNLELVITPLVRAINVGVEAELRYEREVPSEENQTKRTDTIELMKFVDGSLRQGSGYVIAPEIFINPGRVRMDWFLRAPLEDINGSNTSRIAPFVQNPETTVDAPYNEAILEGGFSQSAVHFDFEVAKGDENIASVSLIVDGREYESKTDAPFSFLWIPPIAKDYAINAIVTDYYGNTASTATSIIAVDDYSSSGVRLNILGPETIVADAGGTLQLFAEATSPFGMAEVEFFVGGVSVGSATPGMTGSNFALQVDLDDFNFSQGTHLLDVIARDNQGNQAGTFPPELTNITSRKSRSLTIETPFTASQTDLHVKLVYPADLNFTFYEESGFVGIVDLTDRFDKVHTLRMLANGEVKNTIVLQGENKLEQELDRYFLNWPDITPGEYYITFDGINAQGKQIYLPVLDANNAKSTHQGYRILVERTNTKLFPPLVMMTFPLNEFLLTDQSEILLAASATDRDGVVESIKFLIDGEHYQTVEPAVVQRGNQHASVKWSPPGVGVFTVSAIARDNSGNETLSTPVNVSVYSGIPPSPVTNGEKFEITLPFTEDDVIRPIVNDIEQAEAEITAVLVMGPLDELGSIRILEVTNPGAGYLEPPKVRFFGAGQGAQAVAKIGTDPFSPLFGRVTEIALTDHGKGYAPVGQFGGSSGGSRVSIEGGHLHTQVPIKISLPGDEDKYKEVYVLLNGELFDLNRDSNLSVEDSFRSKPFQTAHGFYPGDYQIHALSRDIYNNLQVSIENNVSIKTTKGLRPSAEITYPILSIESINQTSQGDSYEAIGASSEIPIFIDAVDEDGNPEDLADLPEVNLYANNQLLGNAKRVGGNSLKYFFDLQDININAGKYMFNVGAIDYEGNYIRSKNLPIEIVTTMQVPPEIGNLVPTSALDRFSVGTEIFFTVNVRERDRPIRLVEFLADGEVVDSTNEPILSIGDLHIYSGSFTPSRSKDFLFSAVATDLSGVKAFSNAEDTEDNATEGLEELITSRYQIDNIVNGEPINGKDYTIASFVGNRKSTKLTNISVSSTFGSNLAPIASLQIPENVAYARAPEKLKLVVNAQDLDGHSSALSCQFLVNGSNEIIQFKSNPVPGDQIIFSGVDPYEFGVDIVIADDLEKTVVNLYNQLTTDIENGTLSDVYFAFMPENFYSGETDLSLANSIFLRTDSTKVEVNTGLLNSDSINVNHLPYIESSDSGTFLGEWTPTLGGLFVINAVVKDSMGGTVITNSSIMVAERVEEGEKRYKNPDFNGTLVIYPTEALNNPVARGSTLSVRADYTSMQGIPFDDYIQSVQFKYNGVAVGKEQTNGPFSVNVQLTDEEPTWRIEAFANPVNPEVLPLVISAEGAVAPAVRKPSVTLLPPLALSRRSSSQYPTFPDGMELSLQMIAEGADEILRQVERGEFFFNGKSVSGNYREAIRTNAAGQYTAITYTIDVILDFDEYAKLDGDLNVSAMIHMRGMVAPTMAVISGTSDENSFMIKLDVPSPDNISAASLFYDLTGKSLGRQQYQEFLDSGKTEEAWIVEKTNLPSIIQMVDVVAARHVTIGEYFNSYADFKSDLDSFREELVTDASLMSYINTLLSSADYSASNAEVPHLVGPYSQRNYQNFGQNRESFARQCITNKSGQASYSQLYQASIRMLNHWRTKDSAYWEFSGRGNETDNNSGQRLDALSYQNGDIAVEFIFNLVKERLLLGSDPYIYGINPKRNSDYLAASFMYSVWKDTGEYPLDKQQVSSFGAMNREEMMNEVLINRRYKQRHNRLWRYSKNVENAKGWKEEYWFGFFNDYNYPWIYHSKLGWLYTSGASQKNFWAYSDKLGWLWVSTYSYPHVFSATDGAWIYFDTTGPQNSTSRAKGQYGVYYYSYKYRGWSKL